MDKDVLKTEHDMELDTAIKYLELVFNIIKIILIVISIVIGGVIGFAIGSAIASGFLRIIIDFIISVLLIIGLYFLNMWILKICKAFAMVKYYSYENLIEIRNNTCSDKRIGNGKN